LGSVTGLDDVDKSKPPVDAANTTPNVQSSSHLLETWVRIRRGCGYACLLFVACCVGSGFCDKLITGSEESYSVCVCVCVRVSLIVSDLETSTMRLPKSDLGSCTTKKISCTRPGATEAMNVRYIVLRINI